MWAQTGSAGEGQGRSRRKKSAARSARAQTTEGYFALKEYARDLAKIKVGTPVDYGRAGPVMVLLGWMEAVVAGMQIPVSKRPGKSSKVRSQLPPE